MDPKDKNVNDLENGEIGIIANNCLQDNILEVDLATKFSQEHPKTNMISTTSPREKSTKSKKEKWKRTKKKDESKLGPRSMDQTDIISNLSLADASDAHSCGKINNLTDISQESGHSMGKGSAISLPRQHNILEVDLGTIFSQEHPKTDMISTTSPLKKSAKSKKIKRKAKKKAESKLGPQSTDQIDIFSNLSLADASDGHSCGKKNNLTDISQKSGHSTGKGSAISLPRQDNILEVDLATKFSQEYPETYMIPTTGSLEKSAKSKKKKQKRARKKAESKLGPQSMDQTSIISSLSLADASDGHACGKIKNLTDISQESGHSTGKVSAISLSRQEIMKHRSSEVINEAQNYLLADKYRIPQLRKFICPRRKLLVLDVNGLLADIVTPQPRECKADTNFAGRAIFKRPFFRDFLEFCFERFDVGIWSSRSKKIIDKVVAYLLGDLKHKLLFCWDMFYCTQTKFRCLENCHKPIVLKELKKLWEKHDPNLPWEKGDYDESNTLLVDDSPYKALLNPMHTGVFPYSYSYENRGDNSLGPGGDIRVYLEGLATAENVQNYIAQHPFGQGALNETDPHWEFYSKVLHSFLNNLTREVTKV